jgi:hypothetical protein
MNVRSFPPRLFILATLLVIGGSVRGQAQAQATTSAPEPLASPPAAVSGAATPPAPLTRAAWLQAQRDSKADALQRYEPGALERAMTAAESRVRPLLVRDRLYAKFGSITTGSGFAYGLGFRDRSFGSGQGRGRGRGEFDLWAAGSFKGYWALNSRVRHPITARSRVFAEGYARRYA